MADSVRRFAFVTDIHWGYETKGGHKRPLHDPRAWATTLKFLQDFKPQDFFFGGDILDCGAIARHHNKGKPRKTEGFRLQRDAEECKREVIDPITSLVPREGRRVYIVGNHEDWIEDLLDEDPALEGIISISKLLGLNSWEVIPQGGWANYGKLCFLHGDTITGGEHIAKAGVINYERNVRFGHHHTYQVYTKTSPLDTKYPHTGIAVPCLCSKDLGYNERRPNRWVQGFMWGYMVNGGTPFVDNVAIIINGSTVINGKVYKS